MIVIKNIFDENEWSKFNNKEFEYAECSTCTDKRGLDTYKIQMDFLQNILDQQLPKIWLKYFLI